MQILFELKKLNREKRESIEENTMKSQQNIMIKSLYLLSVESLNTLIAFFMYGYIFCLRILFTQETECFSIYIELMDKTAFGAHRKDLIVLIQYAVVGFFTFILQCYDQTALYKEV